MAPLASLPFALLALILVEYSSAHFLLHYPPTIGFDDSLEGTPPCGSFTVDFSQDNMTDFHVEGDSIALTSIHPMATWLFRATLDQTAAGNWTNLLPAVSQTGLGDYCERDIMIPSSWAGSKGVIQVVQDAPDGILFQCSTVNFVAGSVPPPSICTNVTGLSAQYTTDAMLSSLPTMAPASSSMAAPMSTSSSTSKSGADSIGSWNGFGSVVGSLVIAIGTLVTGLI